jgi:hypothetical protein
MVSLETSVYTVPFERDQVSHQWKQRRLFKCFKVSFFLDTKQKDVKYCEPSGTDRSPNLDMI